MITRIFAHILTNTAVLALPLGCDTAETGTPGCTVTIAGIQPGAALVDLPEDPKIDPWIALQASPSCTKADVVGLSVQLFEVGDQSLTYLGAASLDEYVPGEPGESHCAIYSWAAVTEGHGTDQEFSVLVVPPKSGAVAALSSQQLPAFTSPSVLPAWHYDDAWHFSLVSPVTRASCTPN